jgi:hypothetical protein
MIGDGGFAPRDAPLTASAYLCNMHAFLCRGPAELQVAAEIHQSVARRAAILRIIRESTVHNQD